MRLIPITIMLLFTFSVHAEMMLGNWLKINEPKVISYLQLLSAKDKGNIQKGVRLSDGTVELKGFKFAGKTEYVSKSIIIYTFLDRKNEPISYLWMSKDGKPFPLPECSGEDPRYKWPGWAGSDLAGEVYTYRDVHFGHGIIKTRCVPTSWLK